MGLKKYEIITVGSDKRVRALRSWAVGGRYVNIGDVGGIVYDEKTLSQDGACWLFRGNFGFPGARIGGDSIVDVAEATLSTTGAPNVDILGSSTVVGAPVRFSSDQTSADAVTLTAADFEQGAFTYSSGANWETWKTGSASNVRLKAPIFMGGVPATLKLDVPGYAVQAYVLDRDGIGLTATALVNTGEGVTLTVPAGQYFTLRLAKSPTAGIVPADATAAQITTTGVYETKLVVVDSRLELNLATSTATTTIRPGGTYTVTSGAKYPDSIIGGSRVSINVPATRDIRFMFELLNVSAKIDITNVSTHVAGRYSNVKNLVFNDLAAPNVSTSARSLIQAYDCDNMVVNATNFPGKAAAITANMPFIFRGCNVPNGIFYHHAQITNTYKNIDFAKAQADLGKNVPGVAYTLVSSETEGMYRIYNTAANLFGFLLESYDSISSIGLLAATATSYGTTIYKDAYVSGKFDFAGTNVFGNKVRSHPLAQVLNVAPRAVQGGFNNTTTPPTVVPGQTMNTVMNVPLRTNGANGLKVKNVPAGVRYMYVILDTNLKFIQNSGWQTGTSVLGTSVLGTSVLQHPYVMITFNNESGAALTPEDLAGVTVTVYNGCKIVNTSETAVSIKGNFRVEDNATLINCSLIGSGYFGGKAVASGLLIEGSVFMSDNASIIKTAGVGVIGNLKMKDNGVVVLGDVSGLGVLSVTENARLQPTNLFLSEADLIMSGNAVVTAGLNVSGILRLKDNAKVTVGAMTAKGDITVCGSYSQSTTRRWFGKRVIDNENEPEYDNNVKTQYDF